MLKEKLPVTASRALLIASNNLKEPNHTHEQALETENALVTIGQLYKVVRHDKDHAPLSFFLSTYKKAQHKKN